MDIQATKSRGLFLAAVLFGITFSPLLAQVPELETIFYGRIINRTSGQEYQLFTGTMSVTVVGEGVAPIEVTTELKSHADGKYSYVLKMPHQAKSLDLSVDGGALPLFIADTGFENISIKVDGQVARPFGNGLTSFVASQRRRGGVYRLDLELFDPLDDTDGDGIPDWWEDLHGLDKQDPSDALLRWGDNLYTYGDAFRLGLNPHTDDRIPELLTSELVVMEGGATGLLLRTVASTSTPAQIVYQITHLPQGGDLMLRNDRPDPRRPDRVLKAGDSFTQAAIDAGRVEFVHHDPDIAVTELHVAITNNNPDLEPVAGEVVLNVFSADAAEGRAGEHWLQASSSLPKQNDSASEIWRRRATEAFSDEWIGGTRQQDWIAALLLTRRLDYTVWDGTKELPVRNLQVPSSGMTMSQFKQLYSRFYGQARKHVIFAGNGTTKIQGGTNSDVLIAGTGETVIRGNGGADIFAVSAGTTTIEDFNAAESDLLDLSPLLQGWPGPLADKVQLSSSGGNTTLRIDMGGGEQAVVILQDLKINEKQLEALRRKGSVFTGALRSAIYATNDAPVAVADQAYIVAGEAVSIPVLANDFDPDGDSLTLTSVTQGSYGTVQMINGLVVYTPGLEFAGVDEFTYTISDGQGEVADGVVEISYPFPAAAGSYSSLLFADDGTPLGTLNLNLLSGGTFSATLKLGKVRYSGKGSFDPDGAALVTLKAGRATVQLSLNLDLADPSYPLTGSLVDIAGGATLAPAVVAANPALHPTAAKRFTLAAPPAEFLPNISGYGFATITLSKKYVAAMVGKLPDGTPFTASTVQNKEGGVLWSTSLYKGGGWLLGDLSLPSGGGIPPSGSLKWSKPADVDPAFVVTLDGMISEYLAPSVAAVSALDFPDDSARNADLEFSGGGLPELLEVEISFAKNDLISLSAPLRKLKLASASGLLTGTVMIDGVARSIQGAVLQDRDAGFGFFLNGPSAGAVRLSPK